MIRVRIVERVFRRYLSNNSNSNNNGLRHRQLIAGVPRPRHETLPVRIRIPQTTGDDRMQQGRGGYRIIIATAEDHQIQVEVEAEEVEVEEMVMVVF